MIGALSDTIEYEKIPQSKGEVVNAGMVYVIIEPTSGLNENDAESTIEGSLIIDVCNGSLEHPTVKE